MSVFYSNPQRLDVYVDNQLVAPTNAQWNALKTDYTLQQPLYPGAHLIQFVSSATDGDGDDGLF